MLASPSKRTYLYTKIKDLQPDQSKANVFGVVLSFRSPTKSRGRDHSCSVEFVDESELPVKCVLFNIDKTNLPQLCSMGDIICIRRISVSTFNERLQLLASNFSSWILFRKESSKIIPVTSSASYTYTDEDTRRVQQLRDWALTTSLALPGTYPSSPLTRPAVSPHTTNDNTHNPLSSTSQSQSTSLATSLNCNSPSVSDTIVSDARIVRPPVSAVSIPNHPPSTASVPIPVSSGQSQGPSDPVQDPSQGPSGQSQGSSIPAYSNSSCCPVSRRHFQCRIVGIGELVSGENKMAVCGIIKYFKPPTRSKGLDYYVTVALVDLSSPSTSLSCTLFNPCDEKLPRIHSVGDVVIIKGLRTSSYQGIVQARGHEHTLIAVFNSDVTVPVPLKLGDWYKLTHFESSSVHRLKQWMHEKGPLLLNTKLEEISSSHYFNTVCCVAAIAVFEPLHLAVLSIFDGSLTNFSCQSLNFSSSKYTWETERDPCLTYTYQGLICDVFLSDLEYFNVSPGDYVSLVNVYAKPLPIASESAGNSLPQVEFNIAGHGLHKGTVEVLPADCETVIDLEARLPVPFGPLPVWKSATTCCDFKIINEEGIQTVSIDEVRKSPVGSKFAVEVEVVNIGPGPLEEMCQLRCSLCKSKYCIDIPNRSETDSQSRPLTAGDLCIYCSDSDDSGPPLQYMYVFMLLIRDRTGNLDVYVSGDNGKVFLPSAPPTDLYVDKDASGKLLGILYLITGGNDPFYPYIQAPEFSYKRPQLKVCVTSYISHKGSTCYQLVDTVLNTGN